MACCKGDEYGNWCDGVEIVWTDPETGKKYCLFHAPKEHKEISKEEFDAALSIQLNKEEVDLKGTIFSFPVYITGKFNFLLIQECTFYDDAFFGNINATSNITFFSCNFLTRCGLNYIQCDGALFITETKFGEVLQIVNCKFKKEVSIAYCQIKTGIAAYWLTLEDNLLLNSNFPLPVINLKISSSSKTQIKGDGTKQASTKINFENTALKPSKLTIENLSIKKLLIKNTEILFAQINNTTIECYDSSYATSNKNICFDNCSINNIFLNPVSVEQTDFIGCHLPQTAKLRTITSDAKEFFPLKIKGEDSPKQKATIETLEELYRRLKKKALSREAQREASDWHYAEKFFCEKRLLADGLKIEWFILRLYRLLSEYGESVERAGGVLVIFLCIPFLISIYSYFPEHVTEPSQWEAVTKTALDYIPLATKTPSSHEVDWLRIPQLMWQALITFQATLLGFALRNRYRR